MIAKIPYGSGFQTAEIPDENVRAVLLPRETEVPEGDPCDIVREALCAPIGSPRLRDLAKNASHILIIASDHTRPVPSRVIFPPLLDEIAEGNPGAEIRVLIATGCHRPTTQAELEEKFGKEVLSRIHVILHDCKAKEDMVSLGTLPSGAPLLVNRQAAWADLIVSEGFIEPHFFAGFSGGRKSILPGIAARETVLGNHCAGFIEDPRSRTGNLEGNPIHEDMTAAAKMAGLRFIVNVVLNSGKQVLRAYAGDPVAAHAKGCAFVSEQAAVNAVPADVVITSNNGAPLDQNLYQAVKGMTAAEPCVRPGGAVIICASCSDGSGGEDFYHWLADAESARAVLEKIRAVPQSETIPDQWQAHILARVLCRASMIVVCEPSCEKIVRDMHMLWAPTLRDALTMAYGIAGGRDTVVIPDGIGVVVKA